MSTETRPLANLQAATAGRSNGAGAAAILAAGIGCFMVALLAILGDKSAAFQHFFIFSKPTGPLSGVTTSAVMIWLVSWAVLHALWRKRTVRLARVNVVSFALLALGLLLTFPPIADLF